MPYTIRQTEEFAAWRAAIKDLVAKTAIRRRIERAELGNLGDHKSIGEGVSEMRIDVGAGYRVYFTVHNREILFLLMGGNKSTQASDIRNAIAMAKEI